MRVVSARAVDGATGPVLVENAKQGDTLIVEILDISIEKKGVMATIPKQGVLPSRGDSNRSPRLLRYAKTASASTVQCGSGQTP